MNPRYRRKTHQFIHSEDQRTVDHAVDQETMLPRVNVRRVEPMMASYIVKRGGRDDSYRILNRAVHGVPSTLQNLACRGHETGTVTYGVQVFRARSSYFGPVHLPAQGLYRSSSQA